MKVGFQEQWREKSRLSSVLKSNHEENEAYLSEIETILDRHMMTCKTKTSTYCSKLLRGMTIISSLSKSFLGPNQTVISLQIDKQTIEKKVQQATVSRDFLEMKAARIEDQVKSYSYHVHKLAEDRCQNSVALENIQRRILETRKSNQQARESLEESQTRVKNSRMNHSELQIELEKQRFGRKRLEEELEYVKQKAERLTKQKEGSSLKSFVRSFRNTRKYSNVLPALTGQKRLSSQNAIIYCAILVFKE